jgi:dinuclear metal center YbgI/SA1388 family protein
MVVPHQIHFITRKMRANERDKLSYRQFLTFGFLNKGKVEKYCVKDFTDYLESVAPLALQESYDNSGLMVGSYQQEVSGILISLDITEEIIDEAIAENCNLIIAHHPILFSGLKKLNGNNYVEKCVIKAIKNNIALYAAHTNLDAIEGGVNTKISEKLGLQNLRILAPKKELLCKLVTYCPTEHAEKLRNALFAAGGGLIGEYDECSFNTEGTGTFRSSDKANPYVGEANKRHYEKEVKIELLFPSYIQNSLLAALKANHPYEEVAYDIFALQNKHPYVGSGMLGELQEETSEMSLLTSIKSIFGAGCVRYTALLGKKIKTVAVCGGSGSFLLNDAISAKADIFITSDYKYHQFFDAEKRIVIADIGHYESEQFTKELLYDIIRKKFSTFALRLTKINSNPINYL